MSTKQTKQQRDKRVKEVNKFLSETKGNAAEVSYPTVPFEVSSLARTRAEFVALIAALLRPGSTYVKGQPMAAYETYIQRIAFDPATNDLTELSRKPLSRSINISAMAE